MRRDVARYLEDRLCPDVVRVAGALVPADALALLRAGLIQDVGYDHGRLLGDVWPEHLAGAHRRPLLDLPVRPVDAEEAPSILGYTLSGDLDAGRAQLERAIVRADALEAAGTPSGDWPQLAEACRFYTGDDPRAMRLLARAPYPTVADDWVRLFGALGADRVERARAALLATIEQAFDGVPFPGPAHGTLYQAEAWDSSLDCDQARDHTGRWQDLPRAQLLACQWALGRLDPYGLPYYLPAMLSLLVREPFVGVLHEHVRAHLARADRERHRRFTPAQHAAVAAYAAYDGLPAAHVARWRALAGEH